MTTPLNAPAPSTLTSPPSDAREASPEADASSALAPSSDGNAGATQADRLSGDAPVMALIAKLHAGTTLADRVRRMRGRREGMRLRRMAAKAAKRTTLPRESGEPETDQTGNAVDTVALYQVTVSPFIENQTTTTQHNDDNDNETARLNKPA